MFKLASANVNYDTLNPIIMGSKGISSLNIKTQLSTPRELSIIANSNLFSTWKYLKTNPESRLILDLNGLKIGFWQNTNTISHLLVIGDTGQGTDGSTAFGLSNPNADYIDPNYPLDISQSITLGNQTIYYIRDNSLNNLAKNYCEIKTFQAQENSSVYNNVDNRDKAEARVYQQAVYFLRQNNSKLSVNNYILRESGTLERTFMSSIFELKRNKRTLPLNYAHNRTSAYSLLNQIDSSLLINPISPDRNIAIQTGSMDNYDIFNEVAQKGQWSWREDGLVNVGTVINPIFKTQVSVGDFDTLPSIGKAYRNSIDNPFLNRGIKINNIRSLRPKLDIDLSLSNFILEGSKVDIDYNQHLRTFNHGDLEVFDFVPNSLIFDGFTAGIDLYKLN